MLDLFRQAASLVVEAMPYVASGAFACAITGLIANGGRKKNSDNAKRPTAKPDSIKSNQPNAVAAVRL